MVQRKTTKKEVVSSHDDIHGILQNIQSTLAVVTSDVANLSKIQSDHSQKLDEHGRALVRIQSELDAIRDTTKKLDDIIFNGEDPATSLLSRITALSTENRIAGAVLTIVIGSIAAVITSVLMMVFQNSTGFGKAHVPDIPAVIQSN